MAVPAQAGPLTFPQRSHARRPGDLASAVPFHVVQALPLPGEVAGLSHRCVTWFTFGPVALSNGCSGCQDLRSDAPPIPPDLRGVVVPRQRVGLVPSTLAGPLSLPTAGLRVIPAVLPIRTVESRRPFHRSEPRRLLPRGADGAPGRTQLVVTAQEVTRGDETSRRSSRGFGNHPASSTVQTGQRPSRFPPPKVATGPPPILALVTSGRVATVVTCSLCRPDRSRC